MIGESSSLFQGELKRKQEAIDSLHNSLRTTSAQVGEARRTLEALQDKLKAQQLARQKVINLTRACEEEEYQLMQLEQRHGRLENTDATWEMEIETCLKAVAASKTQTTAPAVNGDDSDLSRDQAARLPGPAVLRAWIKASRECCSQTRQAVGALRVRSKERELKYRRLVGLCTRRPEGEIDTLLDTLTRAVESEKGELEIGRVRRFLGGVEDVAMGT